MISHDRPYLAEAPPITEALPVTDDTRQMAEYEAQSFLNEAIETLTKGLSVTFNPDTFEGFVKILRECKVLEREIEGRVN